MYENVLASMNTPFHINPLFCTDSYKLSHRGFMTHGTQKIYSNFTARNMHYLPVDKEVFDGKAIVYGVQPLIIKMVQLWNNNFFKRGKAAIAEAKRLFDYYLGKDSIPTEHFVELQELGYLPIRIKALPEGSRVGAKVPFFTIVNTDDRFAWLTNFLETWISAELWKPMTVATIAYEYRKLANRWAILTTGSTAGTEFQNHDFSYRGMSGTEDAAATGSGVLLSTFGTDNIPALPWIEHYYGDRLENTFLAASVPASEHSLASTGIAVNGELETYRKWISKDYPTGIVSVIADTLDFFRVVTEFAILLKDDILARIPNELGLAKVVFRPDSGDPVKIVTGYTHDGVNYESKSQVYDRYDFADNMPEVVQIVGVFYKLHVNLDGRVCTGEQLSHDEVKGAVQCLWDIFGGTTTEQGYKVLHERVGLIYGDSITLARAKAIYERLAAKGFASTNIVFGIGSFTNQYLTRDSMGMAIKATAAQVNGEWYALSKDPKTDDGTKKSAKGLLRVELENGEYVLYDEQTLEQEQQGALETVFENNNLVRYTSFAQIREKLWS